MYAYAPSVYRIEGRVGFLHETRLKTARSRQTEPLESSLDNAGTVTCYGGETGHTFAHEPSEPVHTVLRETVDLIRRAQVTSSR